MELVAGRLDPGSHPDSPDGCLMEWVSLLAGLAKTDRPECVNRLVTAVAIHLNDSLDDVTRQRLKGFIPALLRARRSPEDELIGIRLAIWAAGSIADSVPERYRSLHDRAVRAAAAHLSGTASAADCRAAAAAAAEYGAKVESVALYVAADAAHAAAACDPDEGTTNAISGALREVLRHGDPLAWFGAFLAEHAVLLSEELLNEELVCSPV